MQELAKKEAWTFGLTTRITAVDDFASPTIVAFKIIFFRGRKETRGVPKGAQKGHLPLLIESEWSEEGPKHSEINIYITIIKHFWPFSDFFSVFIIYLFRP